MLLLAHLKRMDQDPMLAPPTSAAVIQAAQASGDRSNASLPPILWPGHASGTLSPRAEKSLLWARRRRGRVQAAHHPPAPSIFSRQRRQVLTTGRPPQERP